MKKNNDRLGIALFLIPTVVIFVTFFLVPVISVFVTSFADYNGLSEFSFVGFKNYIKLFTYDNTFWVATKNLFLWCLITIVIHVPFGGLVAYILYKNPIGGKFVRVVYMIPNIISAAAWAIMYRFIFNNEFGVINTFIRKIGFENFSLNWFYDPDSAFIAVTFTWVFFSIVNTLLILAALQAIPTSIHEAAQIDGATEWDMAIKIDIPLIKKALSTCMVLSLAGVITQFEVIFLTTRGGPGNKTYNLALMLYDGIMSNDYGYANAVAVLMIILGISILIISNKIFGVNKADY